MIKVKRFFEFATRFSDLEKKLEIRKEKELVKIFKVCRKCGERKLKSSFSKDKRSAGGRINICKVCRSKESLEYYYQNKDWLLIKIKEYQGKKDRSNYFQDYKIKHKEHLRKTAHTWYEKNKKRIKKRNLKRKANLN